MRFLVHFFVVFSLCYTAFAAPRDREFLPHNDPAIYYNMIELVCNEGYYIQEHTVLTEDGYLLGVYRIPGGKRRPKVPKKKTHYFYVHRHYHPDFEDCFRESMNETFHGPPVLLSHGLGAASDSWVLQGPKWDLAFLLADLGYDVWFTNIRGNFYSRRHKTLNPSGKVFWDFSFHENGVYDMTSTIDYILNVTGFQKLYYVGHSMGTTMFFVMASVKPEYNDKIILFVALAPVADVRWNNYKIPWQTFFYIGTPLVNIFLKNGLLLELFPRNDFVNLVARLGCTKSVAAWIQDLCYDMVFPFSGVYSKTYTREKLPIYLTHTISGGSMKTVVHFSQVLLAEKFQNFDYGPEENIRRYSQAEPPKYDYNKITVPVALLYSKGDYVATDTDVDNVKSLLPNVVATYKYTQFSHVDFVWSYRARSLLYKDIIELLEKYRNSTNPDSVIKGTPSV